MALSDGTTAHLRTFSKEIALSIVEKHNQNRPVAETTYSTMSTKNSISNWSRTHLHDQGYDTLSDTSLNDLKYGIRFAYISCGTLVAIGLATGSLWVLATAMVIAFFGAVLTFHPFDLLYNYGFRHLIQKPALEKRTKQNQFACAIATSTIAAIIATCYLGYPTVAYALGIPLLIQAFVVGTVDYCVPSKIYNGLFLKKN